MDSLENIAQNGPSKYAQNAAQSALRGDPLSANQARRLARLTGGDAHYSAPPRKATPMIDPIARMPRAPEDIDNLEQRLRRIPTDQAISTVSATDVIAALIASGATFIEKTGCDSGTPYTYWAPEWGSDPS